LELIEGMAAPKSQLNPARSGRRIEPMTREEIEAKLEAVEARTETRFVELSGKIDRLGEILTGGRGVLAQMAALRTDTFAQMAALKTDTFAQMAALRTDTFAQIAGLKNDVFAQMATLKDDTSTQIAGLKDDIFAQMAALRTDASTQMAGLKDDTSAQMATFKADNFAQTLALKADNRTTRWTIVVTMITSVLAAAALVLGVQANLLSAFQAGQPQGAVSAPR
jgi:hypothetical protein